MTHSIIPQTTSGNPGSAKARYSQLRLTRQPFLTRARKNAILTLPALMPPEGLHASQDLPQPYQGFGSRATINLSSRLLMALLPPGQSFFKLTIPNEILLEAGEMAAPEELTRNLALAEKLILTEVERRNWRAATYLTLQLLIITGNALEFMTPAGDILVYRLDQYVVLRDPSGFMLEMVLEENLHPDALPEHIRGMLGPTTANSPTATVSLYTHVKWDAATERYVGYQEIQEQRIKGTEGEWARDTLPYNALRYTALPGEDYGRSKVDEHYPDLRALDGLDQAILDGAAMGSRFLLGVDPQASAALRRQVARSANGDVVVAAKDQVYPIQFDTSHGMSVAFSQRQALIENLAAAWLLVGSRIRDAERVTAAEIRVLAEELEGALGGVYSMLAMALQRVRLQRLIVVMQAAGKLPPWDQNMVEPQLTVGLEALGREQDIIRVQMAVEMLHNMPPEAHDYVPWGDLLKKLFVGLGLPENVRSEDEVAEIRQQRMMMEAAAQAAGRGPQEAEQAAG